MEMKRSSPPWFNDRVIQAFRDYLPKERLQRGKKRLKALLRDELEHLADADQDHAKKAKASGESDFPPAELDGMEETLIPLYETFIEEWARKWLDEKIPALDGQSPREAVKSPEGKEKVLELLKEFENQEERKKKDGEPYGDVQILRRKLNL